MPAMSDSRKETLEIGGDEASTYLSPSNNGVCSLSPTMPFPLA
jgi:hypothetical protein